MFEPLTSRHDTDRGQAGLLGAMLMFGLVLMLLVLLQVTAVPVWNGDMEFEHNQRVQEDIQNVDTAISQAVSSGGERLVTVKLGVQYPERPFLFNPADTSGQLATTDPAEVHIKDSSLVGVDSYWTADQTFETRTLQYRPNYNEYESAPTTVYEHGQVYNRFDDGTVRPLGAGNVVNGKRISLVALSDDTSESAVGARSFTVTPTSAPAQTVQLESEQAGKEIVIELPTRLNESQWTERLGDEIDSGGVGNDVEADRYISRLRVKSGTPYNTLELTLEPDTTYGLRMGAAALGDASPEPVAYLTGVDEPQSELDPSETVQLTFQVRDQYNNPVSGVSVEFDTLSAAEGMLTALDTTTDASGEVTARYTAPATPPAGGSVDVTATADGKTASTTVAIDEFSNFDRASMVNPPKSSGGVYMTDINVGSIGKGNDEKGTIELCLRNAGPERTFSEARFIAAYTEQNSQSWVEVSTVGRAKSERLDVTGGFEDIAQEVGTINSDSSMELLLTFSNTFSPGNPKTDSFKFAVRYTHSGGTDTMVYEIVASDTTFDSANTC